MERVEKIIACLNNLDTQTLINAWNEYCDDENPDDRIYDNDEHFLNEMFENADAAVRAACYGEYNYADNLVVINAYGNLDSFNYIGEENSPFSEDTLADWLDRGGDCYTLKNNEELNQIMEEENDDDGE